MMLAGWVVLGVQLRGLLLFVVAAFVWAGASTPGYPAARDRAAAVLAPFEGSEWPAFLDRLDLPETRNYAVLIMLPTAYPIDLTDAETARSSLLKASATPSSRVISKTLVGHAMVGWQCGGRYGLVSKTGEGDRQVSRMLISGGWGITPLLSTFTDGHLVPIADIPGRYRRQIAAGRVNVLAAEISAQDCLRLRRQLVDYIEDPRRPARRFTLLDSGRVGDGCTSFAVSMLASAGVLKNVNFRRRIAIHADLLGRRLEAPANVEPYVRARTPDEERVVSFWKVRAGPWNTGPVHSVVDVLDPELVYSAMVSLRVASGAPPSWRESRALPAGDPVVARTGKAARAWAGSRYSRVRTLDPATLSALVLER